MDDKFIRKLNNLEVLYNGIEDTIMKQQQQQQQATPTDQPSSNNETTTNNSNNNNNNDTSSNNKQQQNLMQAEIFKRQRGIIIRQRKLASWQNQIYLQIQRNNQLVLDQIEQQLQLLCQSMGVSKADILQNSGASAATAKANQNNNNIGANSTDNVRTNLTSVENLIIDSANNNHLSINNNNNNSNNNNNNIINNNNNTGADTTENADNNYNNSIHNNNNTLTSNGKQQTSSLDDQLDEACDIDDFDDDLDEDMQDVDDESDEEEVDLYTLEQQHNSLRSINNSINNNGDSSFNPAMDAASSWSKFIASFQNIKQFQQQNQHDPRVGRNEQRSPLPPLQINNNDCDDNEDIDADTDLLEAECLENEPDVDQDAEADIEQAEADFICGECNKSFNSLRKLRHHKVVHSNEFPYECDASGCFKRFKRKFGLDLHMATHFEFSPDMYTKTPNNSSLIYFDIHRKQNQQQQGLYCKKCNSAFKTILEYQNHMLKHSDRPFKCPMSDCNQSFSSWKSFQKHRASHCFNYHCQVDPNCRHRSTNLQLLKLHIFSCHYKGKLQPEISRSLENDAQPPTGAISGQITNNNQDYYSDVASMDAVTSFCSDVNDMPEDMSCQQTSERNHKNSHDDLHDQGSSHDINNSDNNNAIDTIDNHNMSSLTSDKMTVANIEASMAQLNQYQSPLIASYLSSMDQDNLIRTLTERTKQRYEELTRAGKRDHQKMIIKSLLSESIRRKRSATDLNMAPGQLLQSPYDSSNQSGNASIDLRTSQNKLKKYKLENNLDLGYPMALDIKPANHASSPSTPIPYHNNNSVNSIMAKTSLGRASNQRGQISTLSTNNDVDFKCDTCGSSFDDRHRLMQHQSIHLELKKDWFTETPVEEVMKIFNRRRGEFLCDACNLRFEATFDYDKHNHSVHGQRPYCCQFCGNGTRTFRFWRQYLNHLYDHRYIFSCTIDECDFTVNRRDSLRFHIFRFHLNCQLPQKHLVNSNNAQIQQSQAATS